MVPGDQTWPLWERAEQDHTLWRAGLCSVRGAISCRVTCLGAALSDQMAAPPLWP